MPYTFDWSFERESFDEAQCSKEEDDIFGWVRVASPNASYLVDIHREYYNSRDYGYDLEVFRQELEYGGHGAWAGSVKSVRHVTAQKDPLGRFKRRAEKALAEFISEYEARAWA